MPVAVRKLSPKESLDSLDKVDLEAIAQSGKKLILLDVDNTMLPWRSRDIPQSTRDWLDKGRAHGLNFFVLSNTRHPERLEAITKELGLEFCRDKFKPSTKMYKIALEKFGVRAEDAVMIGDQLLTDILGANRSGIDAVWIRPMEKREFVGTRYLSRNVERFLGLFLYRYFQPDANAIPHDPGFFQHDTVRQFVKFCVVGLSSTLIDAGLHYALLFVVPAGQSTIGGALGQWLMETFPSLFGGARVPTDAAFPVLKVPTACLAILNAFYWNRKWTFGLEGSAGRSRQLRRYFLVALSGMALNTFLTTVFNRIVAGHPKVSWAVATAIATAVVAFWNFFGSKIYTFRDADAEKA